MIFSIAMGAEYLSNVKSIATFAPTFYGYIIPALASVLLVRQFLLSARYPQTQFSYHIIKILATLPVTYY